MRWACLLVLGATVSTAAAQPVLPGATVRLELSDGRLVEGSLASHDGTTVAWYDDGTLQQGTAQRLWVRRRGYLDLSGGINNRFRPDARIAAAFELARSARTAFAFEAAFAMANDSPNQRLTIGLVFLKYR